MRAGTWIGAAALLVSTFLGQSQAGTSGQFETEYGSARAPIGFVTFCATNPEDCRADGHPALFATRADGSDETMAALAKVNSYVNDKIKPVSDQELYGVAERWAIPVNAGDCEDYVLLKKRYLEDLGLPAQALLITVVLDEHNEGHAVLTVATKRGDYVLDNRRNEILRWNDTNYTFLKRQSSSDPMAWVSLGKRDKATNGTVATRSE